MPRRKISTNENSVASVAELDDDEELVFENTRRIRRQRRQAPVEVEQPAEPEVITGEVIDDDDDTSETPAYSASSLASWVYGDPDGGADDVADEYGDLLIRREPDEIRDSFAVPCSSRTWLPKMRNISLAADEDDIYERVRDLAGSGGRYILQLQIGGRIAKSKTVTIADPLSARMNSGRPQAGEATVPAISVATPSAPVDPIDDFISKLEQQKRMRTLLYGDDEKRQQDQIETLRAEIAELKTANPQNAKSEKLALLEAALAAPTEARDRLLNRMFPADDEEGGSRHWAADVLDVVIQNKDTILGVVAGLLGGMPQPQQPVPIQQPASSLDDFMRQPAPGQIAKPTGFQRRMVAEPPAETPPVQKIPDDASQPSAPDASQPSAEDASRVSVPPAVAGGSDATDPDDTEPIQGEVVDMKPKRKGAKE